MRKIVFLFFINDNRDTKEKLLLCFLDLVINKQPEITLKEKFRN